MSLFELEKTEIPAFLNSKPVSGALYVSLYAFGKVLSRFNFKRRKYTVYIALIKRAEQFTTIFEQMQESSFESKSENGEQEERDMTGIKERGKVLFMSSNPVKRKMAVGQMNVFDL